MKSVTSGLIAIIPGKTSMKSFLTALVTPLVLLAATAAQAQTTVDVAKISCRQFLFDKIAPTKTIAIWLSGYYNGTRNNTAVDVGAMQVNIDKVQDYCRLNLDVTVMDAVKNALGVDK
jgi:hypothetical protein